MDFDNRKVYGDTSITDGLVLVKGGGGSLKIHLSFALFGPFLTILDAQTSFIILKFFRDHKIVFERFMRWECLHTDQHHHH